MRPFPKRSVRALTFPLALGLGLLVGGMWPESARFEDRLNLLMPSKLDPRVLVVSIDDATLGEYTAPLTDWNRERYAAALTTLEQAGAKVVGVDIFFSSKEEDNTPAVREAFSAPNVVLASPPGDVRPLQSEWKAARGVSALNNTPGAVREIQTAYPLERSSDSEPEILIPSFAAQVVRQAGVDLPLESSPRLLRFIPPEAVTQQTISFQDLVRGTVRYRDLQGRVVLIGANYNSRELQSLTDLDGREVSGLTMQARAVSTLLQPPLQRLPLWLTLTLCMGVALLALRLGGLWAYALAGLGLLLSVALWQANIVFPGIAVSLCAVLAAGLVALERKWTLHSLRMRDPLTGLGNRGTFTQVLSRRWTTRGAQPFALAMVDLSGFRHVNEAQGRAAGDALLREVAQRLQKVSPHHQVFRWGADEFAVLLNGMSTAEAQAYAAATEQALTPLESGGLKLQVNVGVAHSSEFATPPDLVEGASRLRYRAKYQRVQQDA